MLKKFLATLSLALLLLVPTYSFAQEAAVTTDFDTTALNQENPFANSNTVSAAPVGAMGAMFAAFGAMLVILVIPLIGVLVYLLIAMIKIAQKTHTPNGWLVITLFAIPFKVAKFAGMSYWYGLISFAFIPFYLIDERLVTLVAFAGTCFTVYLWMRICQRLGFSKWLGLLMFVPIANLVLPGVLAFSKNQLVE